MKSTWTQPILSLLSIDKTATGSQPGWIESCLASFENEEYEGDGIGRISRPFDACRTEGNEYEERSLDGTGGPSITPPASAVAS